MSRAFHVAGDEFSAGLRRSMMGRLVRGIVTAVDTVFGIIKVEVEETLITEEVELSFGSFSLTGTTSSWFRYMPQEGSVVLLAYRPSGKPELVAYSPIDYRRLSELKNEGLLNQFRTLQPGEYDLRSSGGAGFYANAVGNFMLYAGSTQFVLNSDEDEIRDVAGLTAFASVNDTFRFGVVKRRFADNPLAEHQVPVPGSSFQEFTVGLVDPLVPLLKKVVLQFGDVFGLNTTVPTPDLDPNLGGLPLRGRMEFYDTSQVTKTSMNVNQEGDIGIDLSPLALAIGMKIVGLVNKLFINFLQITIQSLTNLSIQAGASIDITTAGSITINGSQITIAGGTQGLMQSGAIAPLIAHQHPIVTTPAGQIAGPSSELSALVAFQTFILRAN